MFKHVCVWAALLTISVSTTAQADDKGERKVKRAQKVAAALSDLGISSEHLNNLAKSIDNRHQSTNFYLASEHVDGPVPGKVGLRYSSSSNAMNRALNPGGGGAMRRLQLSYTPDDSRYELAASSRGIMLRYHYEIPINR
ncbi:MAG: hypothetical protein EBV03_02830 [Proteobacteria bacterium]|nr:hypothetical protein [Pseudomonadota bacterium]